MQPEQVPIHWQLLWARHGRLQVRAQTGRSRINGILPAQHLSKCRVMCKFVRSTQSRENDLDLFQRRWVRQGRKYSTRVASAKFHDTRLRKKSIREKSTRLVKGIMFSIALKSHRTNLLFKMESLFRYISVCCLDFYVLDHWVKWNSNTITC